MSGGAGGAGGSGAVELLRIAASVTTPATVRSLKRALPQLRDVGVGLAAKIGASLAALAARACGEREVVLDVVLVVLEYPEFDSRVFFSAHGDTIFTGCAKRLSFLSMSGEAVDNTLNNAMVEFLMIPAFRNCTPRFRNNTARPWVGFALSAALLDNPVVCGYAGSLLLDFLRKGGIASESIPPDILSIIDKAHTLPVSTASSPVLLTYHDALVSLECVKIQNNAAELIASALSHLPSENAGDSKKRVLLLHEIGAIMSAAARSSQASLIVAAHARALASAILAGLSSHHFQVCVTSLKLYESTSNEIYFMPVTQDAALRDLRTTLLRGAANTLLANARGHWNNEVQRTCARVLESYLSHPGFLTKTCGEEFTASARKIVEAAAAVAAPARPIPAPAPTTLTVMDVVVDYDAVLGRGSFGVVRRAYLIRKGAPRSMWPVVALKSVRTAHASNTARESAALAALQSHSHIVDLFGTYDTHTHNHTVLEYASHGDLFDFIGRWKGDLSGEIFEYATAALVSALVYIHSCGYVYGDLKPENVLITSNGTLKLSDFGATRSVSEVGPGVDWEGTAEYLPPESAIVDSVPGVAHDAWCLGLVRYAVYTRKRRFSEDFFADTSTASTRRVAITRRDPLDEIRDITVRSSLLRNLSIDPSKRDLGGSVRPWHSPSPIAKAACFNSLKTRAVGANVKSEWKTRTFSMMYAPAPTAPKTHAHAADEGDDAAVLVEEERTASWVIEGATFPQFEVELKTAQAPPPLRQAPTTVVPPARSQFKIRGVDLTAG